MLEIQPNDRNKGFMLWAHKISADVCCSCRTLHIIWHRVINSLWRVRETIGHYFSFYYHFIITIGCLYGRIKTARERSRYYTYLCITRMLSQQAQCSAAQRRAEQRSAAQSTRVPPTPYMSAGLRMIHFHDSFFRHFTTLSIILLRG